jgi:DNA-binding GntR family transcriptional regulator
MGKLPAMDDPRLFARAAETIAGRIASGEYEHGQRLNIGLIAAELGVSRRTVSHALAVLGDRGLVGFFEGLGWHVV